MRPSLLLACLFTMCSTFLFAQKSTNNHSVFDKVEEALKNSAFPEFSLTKRSMPELRSEGILESDLNEGTLLDLNLNAISSLRLMNPDAIKLSFPIQKNRTINVNLIRNKVLASDFIFRHSDNRDQVQSYTPGLYYLGIVDNDPHSLVAISVFEDEIIGTIFTNNGNYVIGKLKKSTSNKHIIYNDQDLSKPPNIGCSTPDEGSTYSTDQLTFNMSRASSLDCIGVYIEIDDDIVTDKGGATEATNYLTGIMNEVITLYANDNITMVVSEILAWTTPAPYNGSTSLEMLTSYEENTGGFNGVLSHLVSYQASGGYASSIGGLCDGNVDQRKCFSSIDDTYEIVPTYSWTVYVMSHEMGHLLGSHHTHSCVWNGNNTAIDGCAAPAGNCPLGPIPPPNGGTLMSYCSFGFPGPGIGFTLGFGPQPQAVILNTIANATCTPNPDFLSDSDECLEYTFTAVEQYGDHSWFVNGNLVGNDEILNHTFPDIGSYDVTHEIVRDCSDDILTKTIDVGTVDASFDFDIDICQATFTPNNISGNHLWTFGDGNSSTSVSPTHGYSDEATFNVSHTLTNACGTNVETLPITIEETCCECQMGQGVPIIIGQGETLISQISPSLDYVIGGRCFEVAPGALLIIDQNHFILHSTFIMGEGSEIKILPNIHFSAVGATLKGCTKRWKGITMLEGAHVDMGYSNIEDAYHAINVTDEVELVLYDVVFDKNVIGVYFNPTNANIITTNSPILKNNTFTRSGDLLSNYSGEPPFNLTDVFTPCGIYARNTSITIGSSPHTNNYASNFFDNLSTGIRIHDGFASVKGTTMNSVTFGIRASNSFLLAVDNVLSTGGRGIQSDGGLLNTTDNTISDCTAGGIQNDFANWSVNVEDNILTNANIKVGATTYEIVEPKVRNNNLVEGNIILEFLAGGANGNFGSITGNVISVTDFNSAIQMNDSEKQLIYDNMITLNGTNTATGISLSTSNNLRLKDNIVNGTVNANTRGISTTASIENYYCCNTVSDLDRGIGFEGVCVPSYLYHNNTNDNNYGIYCFSETTLGEQVTYLNPPFNTQTRGFGNLWLGTFTVDGAIHNGNDEEKLDSRFFVQDADSNLPGVQTAPPYWPSQTPDLVWFTDSNNDALTCITDICNDSNIFPEGLIGGEHEDFQIKSSEIRVATSGYTLSPYSDMLNWETGKNLIRRLKDHPELLGENTAIDSFYFAVGLSNMDKLVDLEIQLSDLGTLDQGIKAQLDGAENQIYSKLDQINGIDSLYFNSTDSLEQVNLMEQRKTIVEEITLAYVPMATLLDSLKNDRMNLVQNAITLNNTIAPTSIFESNEKEVYRIYLTTVAQGILVLDSTQFASISTIAHQCPKEGGNIVYTARTLYNLNEEKVFDDNVLCSVYGRSEKEDAFDHTILDQEINIYPNPAKRTLNIQLPNSGINRIEIHAAYGKQMIRKNLSREAQTIQLDVSHLTPGLYFCSFYKEGALLTSKKVMIIY